MSDFEAVGVLETVEELYGNGLGEDNHCSVHVHAGLVIAIPRGDVLTCQVRSLIDNPSKHAVLSIIRSVQEDVSLEIVMVDHFRNQQKQVSESNDGVLTCDCEVVDLVQQTSEEELEVGTGDFLVGLEELRDHGFIFRN